MLLRRINKCVSIQRRMFNACLLLYHCDKFPIYRKKTHMIETFKGVLWELTATKKELALYDVASRGVSILKDGDVILSRSLPYISHLQEPMAVNPRNRGETSLSFVRPHVRQVIVLQVHNPSLIRFGLWYRQTPAGIRNNMSFASHIFVSTDEEDNRWILVG